MRGKQTMRSIKKCIYAFPVSLLLIVCLSLSAFAYDSPQDEYRFTLPSYPVNDLSINNQNKQSWSYFIQNSEYEVFYIEMICDSSNYSAWNFGNYLSVSLGSYASNTPGYYYLYPFIVNSQARPGYSFSRPLYIWVYDTEGNLLFNSNGNGGMGGSMASPGQFPYINWYFNGTSIDRFCLMLDQFRYVPGAVPSTYSTANNWVMSHWTTGYPDYLLGFYNVVSPDTIFESSIEGNIYVNDTLVYGSGGGSDGNLASKIIGSAIGNISLPDGNGGTVSGDVNVSVDLDMPDKEFNNGITYPDMSDINDTINDNMTELDIMDTSTDAFDFIYTKINEFAHANNKILIMFTSCLSAGVIMIILNKRGV